MSVGSEAAPASLSRWRSETEQETSVDVIKLAAVCSSYGSGDDRAIRLSVFTTTFVILLLATVIMLSVGKRQN